MNEHEKGLERMFAELPFNEGAEAERLLTAALAQARADALEEAQEAVGARFRELDEMKQKHEAWRCGMLDMHAAASGAIQALTSTPPASIPVAKVREVLLVTMAETETAGVPTALAKVALRLGVPLDGGEGFPCCGGSDETPPEHTQDCHTRQP
jgi:hypothetical protein